MDREAAHPTATGHPTERWARRFLTRKALLNLIGPALPLVVAIMTVPLIAHGLGSERYEILSIGWIILRYFRPFDLDRGAAATRFATEARDAARADRVPENAWTAALIQAGPGAVGGVVLVSLAPLLAHRAPSITPGFVDEARFSLYFRDLAVPAVFFSGCFRVAFEAA
jgi:hypothetical protein